MPKTAQEVLTIVRDLPPEERLRLAALILQELTQAGMQVVAQSDTWCEQDQKALTIFSLQHAEQRYPEEEELV